MVFATVGVSVTSEQERNQCNSSCSSAGGAADFSRIDSQRPSRPDSVDARTHSTHGIHRHADAHGVDAGSAIQIAVSPTLLVIGIAVVAWIAGKIYRVGILSTGKVVTTTIGSLDRSTRGVRSCSCGCVLFRSRLHLSPEDDTRQEQFWPQVPRPRSPYRGYSDIAIFCNSVDGISLLATRKNMSPSCHVTTAGLRPSMSSGAGSGPSHSTAPRARRPGQRSDRGRTRPRAPGGAPRPAPAATG